MRASEKPNYGMDAPEIVRRWGIYGICLFIISVVLDVYLPSGWPSLIVLTIAFGFTFGFLMPAITIPIGSLFLKFKDRDWLFANLKLQGFEKVLDVGCGHGLLLIGAAKRLTSGTAHGLDLWVQADQADNSRQATLKNAVIEGVENKIKVHDGDMREMPFGDATFDAITSSWAIHNIYDEEGRRKALSEMVRVLKPGGKIAILDIDHARSYRDFFAGQGLTEVRLHGPHFTFGNRTYLVTASKPEEVLEYF